MPAFDIEINGPNVIAESERSGNAHSLFWPWAGANVSLLALSYGAFFLGFGISFTQATIAAFVGTIGSFFLVGISSLAGKRSNAPTMVLSRASFGVKGSRVPGALSYLVFVGWEIVTLTVIGGVLGFKVIMKLQKLLTISIVLMTLIYIALTIDNVSWITVTAIPSGNFQSFVGAVIFAITGIGLGWVNAAADYSRYLPRSVSSTSVVGWTVLGASTVPIILVIYGAALSGSSKSLSEAISLDPIGALTTLLPTWFLIPFALVAILGLVGGAILNLYSSGLALVSMGVPVKRYQAAIIDAIIMFGGAIYIVWVADNFFYPFQGFLITLGVPVAVWSSIFVADVLIRKKAYSEKDLFDPSGMYGSINKGSIALMIVGSIIGWGFVTNTFAPWLEWQGYFLDLIGGKEGPWAYSNVGVIFALLFGFFGHLLLARRKIRAQESSLS